MSHSVFTRSSNIFDDDSLSDKLSIYRNAHELEMPKHSMILSSVKPFHDIQNESKITMTTHFESQTFKQTPVPHFHSNSMETSIVNTVAESTATFTTSTLFKPKRKGLFDLMSIPEKEDEEELKPRNMNQEESEFANEPTGFCALSESVFIPRTKEEPLRTLETLVEKDLEPVIEEEESDKSAENEKEFQIEEESQPENKSNEEESQQETPQLEPEVVEIHEDVVVNEVIEHSEPVVTMTLPKEEKTIVMEDKSVNTDFSDLHILKMPTIVISKGVDTSELIQEEDTEIQDGSDYCNDELPKMQTLLTPDRNDQTELAMKAFKARLVSRFDGIRNLLQSIKEQQIHIKKHVRKSVEKVLKIFSEFTMTSLAKLIEQRKNEKEENYLSEQLREAKLKELEAAVMKLTEELQHKITSSLKLGSIDQIPIREDTSCFLDMHSITNDSTQTTPSKGQRPTHAIDYPKEKRSRRKHKMDPAVIEGMVFISEKENPFRKIDFLKEFTSFLKSLEINDKTTEFILSFLLQTRKRNKEDNDDDDTRSQKSQSNFGTPKKASVQKERAMRSTTKESSRKKLKTK